MCSCRLTGIQHARLTKAVSLDVVRKTVVLTVSVGTDCLLAQLRDDRGYRIVNSSGFETNFEINDVRPAMSEELEFFVDITHVYTYEARIPTTFLQIGAPILGQGWQTYYFPLDGHTNMMYFKFKNTFLGAGELSDFILHTHMTFLDSLYIFKGQHAFEALQDFRKMNTGSLPYVFECHKQDFEATSKKLLASISCKFLIALYCLRLCVSLKGLQLRPS